MGTRFLLAMLVLIVGVAVFARPQTTLEAFRSRSRSRRRKRSKKGSKENFQLPFPQPMMMPPMPLMPPMGGGMMPQHP